MHHGQHKDVDVGAAELPIGPVYGQTKRAFYGQQAEDVARDEVSVKVEFGEKALDSPQTRRRLRGRVKNGWQEAETHCFGLAQGYDKQRYELDVCQVDVFFKKVLNVSDNWLFLQSWLIFIEPKMW